MSDDDSEDLNLSEDEEDDDFASESEEEDVPKKKKGTAKEEKEIKKTKRGSEKVTKAAPNPPSQNKRGRPEDNTNNGNNKLKKTTGSLSLPSNPSTEAISLSSSSSSAAVPAPSTSRSNSNMTMKGPPVATPLEARNLVRDYMLQQNRPFSLLQIHDNLHQRVAKAQLQRALDELCTPGPKCCLRVKDYGKSKIYFADQSLLPAPDSNTLRTLQETIVNLSETLREQQEKEAQLKAEFHQLNSEPSDSIIDSEISSLEAIVAEKRARLNRLLELSSSSKNGMTSTDLGRDRTVAIDTFNFYRNAWKTRKEKAMDVVDMICDGGLGKNRKDAAGILGVDLDEDEGIVLPKPLSTS